MTEGNKNTRDQIYCAASISRPASHIHKERKWGKALFLFRNFSPLS